MSALHWLEKTLHKLYQQVYFISIFIFLIIGVTIAVDVIMQINVALPPRLLGNIGRSLSKVPILFGTMAVTYYILRAFHSKVFSKNKISKVSWMKPYINSILAILQLIHPALGVLAISFAAIHGYMMWISLGGLQGGNVILSGLALMATSTIIALVGTSMQLFQQRQFLKYSHRMLVIVNIGLYMLHRFTMKPNFLKAISKSIYE